MPKRILIVEDDEVLRDNIAEILGSEGYEIYTGNNGIEGKEEAERIKPDLIISDIMMPEADGFRLLEEILSDKELASTPIIFLTAKADKTYIRKGMQLGADDYITKPFEVKDLLDTVKIRLKKSENAKEEVKNLQDEISRKVPHELRTPLVPILGFSELIGEMEDLEEIKKIAKVINKNGKYLHEKIEKFLIYKDLVLLEKDDNKNIIEVEELELNNNLISSYISDLDTKLSPTERVEITIEPVEVKARPELVKVLFKELAENGLKYSTPEDKVKIGGNYKDGKYEIAITNTGRGMSEKEVNSLDAFGRFGVEKFYESGLGLGLAISKKICNYLGYELRIESKENSYTKCKIVI